MALPQAGVGTEISDERDCKQRDAYASAHAAIRAVEIKPGVRFACAAVTHCSRFRRLTNRRNSVRPIASIISQA